MAQPLPQERVAAVRLFWEAASPEQRCELLTLDVGQLRVRAAGLTAHHHRQAGAWRSTSIPKRCTNRCTASGCQVRVSHVYGASHVGWPAKPRIADSCYITLEASPAAAAEAADAVAAGEELLPLPAQPTLAESLEAGLSCLPSDKKTWKVGSQSCVHHDVAQVGRPASQTPSLPEHLLPGIYMRRC